MKKVLIIVSFFMCVMPGSVQAAEMPAPVQKLTDGFAEILKSPLELIKTPQKEMEYADNKFIGFLKGILKAPFSMVEKLGHGATNVASFPVEAEEDMDETIDGAMDKVAEGIKAMFTSPMQIMQEPQESAQEAENSFLGFLGGILKAPFKFIEQFGHGLTDVVSSPASID